MRELIFSGIMISGLFAILFFTKRNRIYSDNLFGLVFSLGSGILLCLFFQAAGHTSTAWTLQLVIAGFPQLSALFFYAAVRFITSNYKLRFDQWLLRLIPVVAFYWLFMIVYLNPGFIQSSRMLFIISTLFFTLFNIVVTVVYLVTVLKLISKYRNYMITRISNLTHISFAWIRIYVGVGLIGTGLSLVVVIFYISGLSSFETANSVISAYSVISLFFIGFYGFRSGNMFARIIRPELQPEKYGEKRLDDSLRQLHAKKLGEYMTKEKPYLDPNLTIGKLAKATEIPVNDLSQVLNDHLNQNFFDYVNRFRVEEVIRMIDTEAGKRFSLLGLAFESGFNSKSNFNMVFKKVTGKTPSRFSQDHFGKKKS